MRGLRTCYARSARGGVLRWLWLIAGCVLVLVECSLSFTWEVIRFGSYVM